MKRKDVAELTRTRGKCQQEVNHISKKEVKCTSQKEVNWEERQ